MSFLHAGTPTRLYADTRPFGVAALPRCDLCGLLFQFCSTVKIEEEEEDEEEYENSSKGPQVV